MVPVVKVMVFSKKKRERALLTGPGLEHDGSHAVPQGLYSSFVEQLFESFSESGFSQMYLKSDE